MYAPDDNDTSSMKLGERLPRAAEAKPQPAPMTLVNAKECVYQTADGKLQTLRPLPGPRHAQVVFDFSTLQGRLTMLMDDITQQAQDAGVKMARADFWSGNPPFTKAKP